MCFPRPGALCLGLFLSGLQVVSGGFEDVQLQLLPPPKLSLEPGFPAKLGSSVTYLCVGAFGSQSYRLVREERGRLWTVIKMAGLWGGRGAMFNLTDLAAEQAGRYLCVYEFGRLYSKNSDKVPLIIRNILESPFLWVSPPGSVGPRQTLYFHCNSTLPLDKYYLYHGAIEANKPFIEPLKTSAHEAQFFFQEILRHQLGEYLCLAYHSYNPYHLTGLSNKVPPLARLLLEGV
ncbi:leukocyte-associated immunoglobulin-like receptor 2 isoform X2 [Sarcophilus harrisii]|uniref:leukocyte-associated immunoglobulin-like receptor 2 isoform X2 n=1 Tax=Sarcophilus harrisii TaxID=9305 RepID=UPI001301C1EA|nr:leukocyte-associated immunoglobulin-like receptor 2 isoform X2 [Sarcophilus harrisii]